MDWATLFGQQPQATPNPTPEQQGSLKQEWQNWFAQPQNQAALMQFGAQLQQPLGLGDTPLGNFSRAVNSGVEAQTANLAEQQAQEQAAAEEARANARLDLSRRASARADANQRAGGLTPNQALQQRQRRMKAYQDFLKQDQFDNPNSTQEERIQRFQQQENEAAIATAPPGTNLGAAISGAPVSVKNADDYAKVPSGTRYVDPTGVVRIKG